MIEIIKGKMNWTDAILAIELGVRPENITRWKKGRQPRTKNYKKLKEIYDAVVDDLEESDFKETVIEEVFNPEIEAIDKEINELLLARSKLRSDKKYIEKRLAIMNKELMDIPVKLDELHEKRLKLWGNRYE